MESYLAQAVTEGQATAKTLLGLEEALGKQIDLIKPFATEARDPDPIGETWEELASSQATLSAKVEAFREEVNAQAAKWDETGNGHYRDNAALYAAREGLHEMAERCRDLTKQIDLAAKLAGRAIDISMKELEAQESGLWANVDINRARRALEEAQTKGVESLRRARYFVRQADWLQERFPDSKLRDVEGLVKLVSRAEIEEPDAGPLCRRGPRGGGRRF